MKNPLKNIKYKKEIIDTESIRKKYINIPIKDYLYFCEENGLVVSADKPEAAFVREIKLYKIWRLNVKELKAKTALSLHNKKQKKFKTINKTTINDYILTRNYVADLYKKLDEEEKTTFADLVTSLSKVWTRLQKHEILRFDSSRVDQTTIWHVFIFLTSYRQYWIRPLSTFKLKGHNPHNVVYDLFKHLVVKHSIPKGLYSLISKKLAWDYLFKVASGGSPKESIPTTIKIPKAKSSKLMENLRKYPWTESVRRTQWEWLKIDKISQKDLFKIADLRIECSATVENNILEFCNYIAQQDMLDGNLLQPLYDYYSHEKMLNMNYSLRGREVFNLIQSMEEWHSELANNKNTKKKVSWATSGLKEYEEERKHNNITYKLTVREITTSDGLNKEGKAQRHCVGSYVRSCVAGNTSIWSVREEISKTEYEILATIEVRSDVVVQAKARRNEKISSLSQNILDRWATSNMIDINI